jgi:hypothetical protein
MRQAFDTAMYYNCHECGGGYYTVGMLLHANR